MPLTRPRARTCLLIIDMINEFSFDGAARVMPAVEKAARHIAGLKRRMKEARLPVLYVTNAVKHFKWEPQGKRRKHKKPSATEIAACRPWLEQR